MKFNSGNTAIKRSGPSLPARILITKILPILNRPYGYRKIFSILDWGSGYGEDVGYYRQNKQDAYGYDSDPKFCSGSMPDISFDIITCNYVLNVLPSVSDRVNMLLDMLGSIDRYGKVFISVRTKKEIDRQAQKNHWPKYNRGYISSLSRNTFQQGLTTEDMHLITSQVGLVNCTNSYYNYKTYNHYIRLSGGSIGALFTVNRCFEGQ